MRDHFSKQSPGELVKNLEGRFTYKPDPLYPTFAIGPRIEKLLTAVTVMLGRLDGMAGTLPDPTILIRSFVRREAQLSSYIENTFANYDEVAEAARSGERSQGAGTQATETLNAEKAILAGVEAVVHRGHPVNNALIRQMHEILMAGVRGHDCRGRYRHKQVYIGNEALGIEAARFVPPAAHLVPDLMEAFQQAWQSDEHFSLVRLAMLHYQFETIHPFDDGNGRLGRILTLLGLCSFGLLTVPLLNASLHFERHRQHYYDGLLRVSTHGDWQGWVEFFLEGLRVAAVESTQKLNELLALQRGCHASVRAARNSALLLTLIDQLFIRPVITVNEAAEVMGVTYAAASQSVQKLISAGILRIRHAGKPMTFVADTILKAVNAEPTRR